MQNCELSTKRIKRADDPLFLQAMSLYETSFPDVERRSVAQNEDLLCDPRFSMLAFCVRGEFAAMAGVWDVDGMLYIEHLCTVPRLRGQGIGAAVLQMLKDEQKTVMLEIEPPVDELTRRRKTFYERCGFGYDPHIHEHPPYREGQKGHILNVMAYPCPPDKDTIKKLEDFIEKTVTTAR